jgi:hypothetical protein
MYRAAQAISARVLVDITPDAPALLDQVLPAVQQLVTETMSSLDDRALHAVLDAPAVANDALDAAPRATFRRPRGTVPAPTSTVRWSIPRAGARRRT